MRPQRWQPTRLPCPWDSPGKNTGVGCHFLLQCMKVKSESEVAQLCPTLSDPMDCSLPGSSVHGIFQARVLEWGAIAFSEKIYAGITKTGHLHFHSSFPATGTGIVLPKGRAPEWDTSRNRHKGLSSESGTGGGCCSHSVVSDSTTPWTGACQAPLSMGFSRQEYCSR